MLVSKNQSPGTLNKKTKKISHIQLKIEIPKNFLKILSENRNL